MWRAALCAGGLSKVFVSGHNSRILETYGMAVRSSPVGAVEWGERVYKDFVQRWCSPYVCAQGSCKGGTRSCVVDGWNTYTQSCAMCLPRKGFEKSDIPHKDRSLGSCARLIGLVPSWVMGMFGMIRRHCGGGILHDIDKLISVFFLGFCHVTVWGPNKRWPVCHTAVC